MSRRVVVLAAALLLAACARPAAVPAVDQTVLPPAVESLPAAAPEPVVEAKPFPWWMTALGALAGSLVGLAGKKTVLKKTKVKAWQAGVGGALLGALGGFIAGKLRG